MSNGYLIGPDLLGRIRRVTDTVDGMPTSTGITRIPTRLQDLPRGGGKVFRICTFTGAWAINASKTVTFKYQTTTPNTVSAVNLFFPVTLTGTRDCAIAKDGTAWFLIDVPFQTVSQSIITGVSGELDSNCNVVITTSGTSLTVLQLA
jgi:hypothetical protein